MRYWVCTSNHSFPWSPCFCANFSRWHHPRWPYIPSSPPNGQRLLAIALLPTTAPRSHPPFGNSCLSWNSCLFSRTFPITQKERKKKPIEMCHYFSMDFHWICPSLSLLVAALVSFSCMWNARGLQMQTQPCPAYLLPLSLPGSLDHHRV